MNGYKFLVLLSLNVPFFECQIYIPENLNVKTPFEDKENINNFTPPYLKESPDARNTSIHAEHWKKVIVKKCSNQYTTTCLKLDIVKMIDRLSTSKSISILPGISLVISEKEFSSRNENSSDLPPDIAMAAVYDNVTYDYTPKQIDSFLLQKTSKYLNSLTVNVQLLHNSFVDSIKEIGTTAIANFINNSNSLDVLEGRGKKNKNGHDHGHGALWSAAAIGLSGLAALSGKALIAASIALVLSLVCLLRSCGHGHGHKSSHYEIITKPAHVEELPQQLLAPSGYSGYARQLASDVLQPPPSASQEFIENDVLPMHIYPPSLPPSIAKASGLPVKYKK